MKIIKYSMTPEEYWQMQVCGLDNIKKEFQKEYLEKAKERLAQYIIEKNEFDNLSEKEKRKIVLSDLILETKKQSNEMNKMNYLLLYGKYTTDDGLNKNYNIDTQYEKTQFILFEFVEKIKLFITNINNRSGSNVTKHPLNPPLTNDEIKNIAFQMALNEQCRLEQNIANYNFFLNIMLAFEDYSYNIEINSQTLYKIKTNCLMFLLNCDYESNSEAYKKFNFTAELIKSIVVRKSTIDNGNGQMIDDRFTVKANSQEIAKIIRDSASHGEYYYQDDSNIRIENSEDIPRISMNVSFNELYNYILSNISERTKEKYKNIILFLNEDNVMKFINENREYQDEISKEFIMLSLFNIVQYNLEHHFQDENMHSRVNLSAFSFVDHLNNDFIITEDMKDEDKLLNIKNAIGHGNMHWEGNDLLLENKWFRKRNKANGRNKDIICNISYYDLLDFIYQQRLYHILTVSQSEYALYKSTSNDKLEIIKK